MTSPRPLAPTGSGALGGPLVHLDTTGSTNDRARELALAGAPYGTVVVAEEQSAGRGRQGRAWTAPRGQALTLSVLVRGEGEQQLAGRLTLLPLAAGVAVCEACEATAPVSCEIKWPNDVLVGERKAAGILIESRPEAGWAVVGIGLNVNTSAEELGAELRGSATSLRIEAGRALDRDQVLEALLERLAARLADPTEPDQLLRAYRERDALYGRRIFWASAGGQDSGEARGINEQGNLIVATDEGELALESGEVHLGPAPDRGRANA
jgi:BirA family biotin operon repressor/biotin-[acetyl-CoA-carboxylase] ligase